METIIVTGTISVALALFIGVYSTFVDLYKHSQNPDSEGFVSAGKNKHFKVVKCDCSDCSTDYWEFKNRYRSERF